ncbi:hypothetical protein AB0F96_16565 [Streptomyces sp. NPDC023998]|uniref:hypothetical protein n=1 Tax=Streptomyces sp. NPDC023998 TaxID=3154597 RepID=UPI0033D0D7CF
MPLHPHSGARIPPRTARVARASNPGGTTATWVRDRLDEPWSDEDFSGRPQAKVRTATAASAWYSPPRCGQCFRQGELHPAGNHWRILRAVEGKGGQPVMAREVCEALGMGVQPQQTEPMRGKLKRLAAVRRRNSREAR